ncbi:MAG: multidrug ABC transporter ATP-binding protein, partial [Candidatus Sericytochromatia bacterium]
YIEEAQEMADRIGIINKGELILVDDKTQLMKKLGKKQLALHLQAPIAALPPELDGFQLELSADHSQITYTFDTQAEQTGIADLLRQLGELGIDFKDLKTSESSLEDIFVKLIGRDS